LPWQLRALMEKPLSASFCLNSFSSVFVVQHGQLAVWIARIVAGSEFHGIDIDALEFLQNIVEG
jgi:hypothetical protein